MGEGKQTVNRHFQVAASGCLRMKVQLNSIEVQVGLEAGIFNPLACIIKQ